MNNEEEQPEYEPEFTVPEAEIPKGKCKVCVTKDAEKGKDLCKSCAEKVDSAVDKAVEFLLGDDTNGNEH